MDMSFNSLSLVHLWARLVYEQCVEKMYYKAALIFFCHLSILLFARNGNESNAVNIHIRCPNYSTYIHYKSNNVNKAFVCYTE